METFFEDPRKKNRDFRSCASQTSAAVWASAKRNVEILHTNEDHVYGSFVHSLPPPLRQAAGYRNDKNILLFFSQPLSIQPFFLVDYSPVFWFLQWTLYIQPRSKVFAFGYRPFFVRKIRKRHARNSCQEWHNAIIRESHKRAGDEVMFSAWEPRIQSHRINNQ